MGVETKIIVTVLKVTEEELEVYAFTAEEAEQLARETAGVVTVLRSEYAD